MSWTVLGLDKNKKVILQQTHNGENLFWRLELDKQGGYYENDSFYLHKMEEYQIYYNVKPEFADQVEIPDFSRDVYNENTLFIDDDYRFKNPFFSYEDDGYESKGDIRYFTFCEEISLDENTLKAYERKSILDSIAHLENLLEKERQKLKELN